MNPLAQLDAQTQLEAVRLLIESTQTAYGAAPESVAFSGTDVFAILEAIRQMLEPLNFA